MRFYDRESELDVLRRTAELSRTQSQFTVIMGRRRIGKTTLMLRAFEDTRSVYLFISRKSEGVLCADLQNAIRGSGIDIPGRLETFGDLLRALMIHSAVEPITVMIDEFQNLSHVNPSIYGDIQEVWDLMKDRARINLVVSGSVHSMMVRIFEDSKEPLFQRCTRKLEVGPFRTEVLKKILSDHNPGYCNRDLLALYMLTGGVPQYVEVLMDSGAVDHKAMLRTALSPGSVFLREGDDLMTAEFGKDNKVYLSILQLIASGICSRARIEDVLKISAGEYLRRLDEEYGFVTRDLPMVTGDHRLGRWRLTDMYLSFYFRYVQPNQSFVEAGRTDLLERTVGADIESYEGRILERYLMQRIREEWEYTAVGGYWNRKGDVEIDIVVMDDIARSVRMIEVKRNPDKLDMGDLRRKADALEPLLIGYSVELTGMSMDDM